MIYSIKQELYKLMHRKIAWIAPIILFILMIMTGFSMTSVEDAPLVMVLCYDATDWIMFILIIVGATSFSMEFQNNAILTLLYKASNKIYVYLSKYIALFIYDIFLHALAIVFTLFLKGTVFSANKVSWSAINFYHQPTWANMLQANVLDLVNTMLIITLVFLLSCLINNNAVVMTTSLLVVFFGEEISFDMMANPHLLNILKWNPFNMLDLTKQYGNYITYHMTTHLTNIEILSGTLIYIMLFFILGYLIFRKKRF